MRCCATAPARARRHAARALGWSNELVAHVVELKNIAPVARRSRRCPMRFQRRNSRAPTRCCAALRRAADADGACIRGWIPQPKRRCGRRPRRSIATYDRIFDCRAPRLGEPAEHARQPAVRRRRASSRACTPRSALVLPLLPALAASSPIAERRADRLLDYRLEAYRDNCARIPSDRRRRSIPETVDDARRVRERHPRSRCTRDRAASIRTACCGTNG